MENQEQEINYYKQALDMVCAELRRQYCIYCENNSLLECDGKEKCWLTKKIQPEVYLEKVKEIQNGKDNN